MAANTYKVNLELNDKGVRQGVKDIRSELDRALASSRGFNSAFARLGQSMAGSFGLDKAISKELGSLNKSTAAASVAGAGIGAAIIAGMTKSLRATNVPIAKALAASTQASFIGPHQPPKSSYDWAVTLMKDKQLSMAKILSREPKKDKPFNLVDEIKGVHLDAGFKALTRLLNGLAKIESLSTGPFHNLKGTNIYTTLQGGANIRRSPWFGGKQISIIPSLMEGISKFGLSLLPSNQNGPFHNLKGTNIYTTLQGGSNIRRSPWFDNKQITIIPSLVEGVSKLGLALGPAGLTGIAIALTTAFGALLVAIPAMALVQQTALNMARPYLEAAAAIDSLKRSLEATTGDSTLWKRVDEMAKAPGISLVGAYKGVSQLSASEFSPEQAMAVTRAIGAANNALGGSQDKFNSAIEAIAQIASKDTLSAQEVRTQLGNAMPGIYARNKEIFGVGSAGELNNVVGSPKEYTLRLAKGLWGKYGKTSTNSPQASLDNLADSGERLKASFGKGLAKYAIPMIDRLSNKLDELSSNGTLEKIGEKLSEAFKGDSIEKMIDLSVQLADSFTKVALSISDTGQAFANFASAISNSDIWSKLTQVERGIRGAQEWMNPTNINIGGWKPLEWLKPMLPSGNSPIPGADYFFNVVDKVNALFAPKDQKKKDLKDDYMKSLDNLPQNVNSTLGNVSVDGDRWLKEQLRQLEEINRNTKPDIQRMVLGGGAIGAKGVTLADLGPGRRSASGGSKVRSLLNQVADEFERIGIDRDRLDRSAFGF